MKLMMAAPSPFVRKVRVMLREADMADQVEEIEVIASPAGPSDDLIAANPLGKIPALVRDYGPTLYDSRVICRFLDDRGDAGLYPQARLWEVLTLEATADGMMDAAVLMVYESRFREEQQRSQTWLEGQWAKVVRALDALENRWMSHLAGPVDMGQIALGCALSYLDFRHEARNWRDAHPNLAAWFAEFDSRESMAATQPSG
ncbi:glutathione S-transferase [Aestuariivita sp.]|jgi:glutathione S-transferase|uniref:glutathione S-transferase n=1 Tax=Aestuariivita sp. TaxID=1872407 RepID=UPI00216DD240|nr:glutathione S-transferase [Aestuariivita sp.]MCE8006967.1 glutathione S-transferase [Aestuariivita sp.]